MVWINDDVRKACGRVTKQEFPVIASEQTAECQDAAADSYDNILKQPRKEEFPVARQNFLDLLSPKLAANLPPAVAYKFNNLTPEEQREFLRIYERVAPDSDLPYVSSMLIPTHSVTVFEQPNATLRDLVKYTEGNRFFAAVDSPDLDINLEMQEGKLLRKTNRLANVSNIQYYETMQYDKTPISDFNTKQTNNSLIDRINLQIDLSAQKAECMKPQGLSSTRVNGTSYGALDFGKECNMQIKPLFDNKPLFEKNYSPEKIITIPHSIKIQKYSINLKPSQKFKTVSLEELIESHKY